MMKALDLFSGAGGLTLGLHKSGWDTTAAFEMNKDAIETYKTNFPDINVFEGDIRDYSFHKYQGIELVAGGPPCQPFSVAGKQLSYDDDRDMVPQFIRAVDEAKPQTFLMENVPGLTSKRHANYLQSITEKLANSGLGYDVYTILLNSADYGVPQKRRRVFIIGLPSGLKFLEPKPTHGNNANKPYLTSGEALKNTPRDEPNNSIVTYAKNPVLRPSPWAGLLINGKGRPINLDAPSPTIPASAGGNRTHIYDPERILYKYHTHLSNGGKPRQGIVMGVRRITVRESARLQTFPDEFIFTGAKSNKYTQVGNAIPPLLANAVSNAVINSLGEEIAMPTSPEQFDLF